MTIPFSYRHLYYFWVVGKEGGMSRAADRLGMAVQTVSTQVRELEQALGCHLLKPAGRGLALTEAGLAAMRQADQIFQLGEALPELVREATQAPSVRLAVGISDGIPKQAVWHLLAQVRSEPRLRLLCHDGEFPDLLGELALHKLDLVISDRPAPSSPGLRFYSHPVGSSPVAWYAAPALARKARTAIRRTGALAQALGGPDLPVLLPTGHGVLRARLDQWFERAGVHPHPAGEFEDSALLETFGASGMGVFPSATLFEADRTARHKVERIGDCDGVEEQFFAITPHKKVEHRLVRRITGAQGAGAREA